MALRDRLSGLSDRYSRARERLHGRPTANLVYRIAVGVVGTVVVVLGIIAIPYPGPGWAIVFLGLGILSAEFRWAKRLLHRVRRRYDQVMDAFARQPVWVRVLAAVATGALVLVTLWLFGALGWAAGLVGIDAAWLRSPLGLGS